jgi:hypothetical protein
MDFSSHFSIADPGAGLQVLHKAVAAVWHVRIY